MNIRSSLTFRQKEVYEFILSHQRDKGESPSISDIATQFKCSRVNARNHINRLYRKGYLTKTEKGKIAFILPPTPSHGQSH